MPDVSQAEEVCEEKDSPVDSNVVLAVLDCVLAQSLFSGAKSYINGIALGHANNSSL